MGDILELKGAIPLKIVNEEIKSGVERVGGCLPWNRETCHYFPRFG
jgi:hypothetical protein